MNTADFYDLVVIGVIVELFLFCVGLCVGFAIGKRSVDMEYYSELRILRHKLSEQD